MLGILLSIWNTLIFAPILNLLVFFAVQTHSLAAAVVILVILMKVVMLPITIQRIRDTRIAALVNPILAKYKKKYKGKIKFEKAKERLFAKYKYHPRRSFISIIVMFPVLIALYQAVRVLTHGVNADLPLLYPFIRDLILKQTSKVSTTLWGTDLLAKPNVPLLVFIFVATFLNSYVNFAVFGKHKMNTTDLINTIQKSSGSEQIKPEDIRKFMQVMNYFMFVFNAGLLTYFMKLLPAVIGLYIALQNLITSLIFGILYLIDLYIYPKLLGDPKVKGG